MVQNGMGKPLQQRFDDQARVLENVRAELVKVQAERNELRGVLQLFVDGVNSSMPSDSAGRIVVRIGRDAYDLAVAALAAHAKE